MFPCLCWQTRTELSDVASACALRSRNWSRACSAPQSNSFATYSVAHRVGINPTLPSRNLLLFSPTVSLLPLERLNYPTNVSVDSPFLVASTVTNVWRGTFRSSKSPQIYTCPSVSLSLEEHAWLAMLLCPPSIRQPFGLWDRKIVLEFAMSRLVVF